MTQNEQHQLLDDITAFLHALLPYQYGAGHVSVNRRNGTALIGAAERIADLLLTAYDKAYPSREGYLR
jgi:hypothetical protein